MAVKPATRPRSILLVAYFYPPRQIIGALRPFALAGNLRRLGHRVTVLSSVHNGIGRVDEGPLVRARDLLATRLNWRRANFEALTGAQADGAANDTPAPWAPGFNFWGALVPPDLQMLSWVPFASAAAGRLVRQERFDVAITTSPPESAHLLGPVMQRRGIKWIADMRDGWRFEPPRPEWPLSVQRRFDAALERRLLPAADAVVMVTQPLANDLEKRIGVRAQVITNGFDPADRPSGTRRTGLVDPDRPALVHTGGIGHAQSLRAVLDALLEHAGDPGSPLRRAELVLAGPLSTFEHDLYNRPEYRSLIRHVGFLPRPEALRLQREATVLVVATSGVRIGEATGKVFEYLDSGRPILVLGDVSAAARIVVDAGAGEAVGRDDGRAAAAALARLVSHRVPDGASDPYLWPELAARYDSVIQTVCQRQPRRGGSRRSERGTTAAVR